jgi:O-antigen/teichoic acid export membrane protein
MSKTRRFVKDSLALTVGNVAVSVMGFVYQIWILRYFGLTLFGKYTIVINYAGYFTILALFGVRQVITRSIATKSGNLKPLLKSAIILRLITAGISLLGIALLAAILHGDKLVAYGLLIYGLSILFLSITDVFEAVFVGMQDAQYGAYGLIAGVAVKLGLGLYLMKSGVGLYGILAVFTVTAALNMGIDWFLLQRYLKRDEGIPDHAVTSTRYILTESLPFFYLSLVTRVYAKNDIMFLGLMRGAESVGIYRVAYLAIDFFLLVGSSLGAALYPLMSKANSVSREQLELVYRTGCRLVVILFVPACIALCMVGADVIHRLSGKDIHEAIPVIWILSWVAIPEGLNIVMGTVLSSIYKQKTVAKLGIIGMIICVGMTVPLIAKFGGIGAALGTTGSSAVMTLVANHAVSKHLVSLDWLDMLGRPTVAGIVMYLVMHALAFNGFIAFFVGLAAYMLALLIMRTFTKQELETMKGLVRGSSKIVASDQLPGL